MDLNHSIDRYRKNNFDSSISASTMVQQSRLRFSDTTKNAMRRLLLLIVVHGLLTPVQSVNGVIWDKEMADFVPIFSKPIFAAMNQERLSRSRAEETHNFQGRTFRFSYYEIENVISSDKNGTSITGYIGDTWNVLAEYLNLTLKLDRVSVGTLGFERNGTFSPGLLKMIKLNQTDIIARLEALSLRLPAAQFTFPFMYSRRVARTMLCL
ncbi:uncharacterized protein LOC143354670 [Halictus rubicundus]|uniref:uncharacterized protein LOC143354670 n=1 Tax=Halictus rubicundus TaxID=77578 RepID=UPI0040354B35